MKGERVGEHGLTLLREQLSERDIAVVADVDALKLVSGRQLLALHFAHRHASAVTAARTCRRVLERLVELRLLVRLERRIGGLRAGSVSFVYATTSVGQRLVSPDGTRRRFREPTATFVHHTLAIGDLLVALRGAGRLGQLELLDVETEPKCWRSIGNGRAGNVLRPDLFVSVGIGDYEYRSFVEVDLGTEGLPRLVAKSQLYTTYFNSGVEQHRRGIFPRVVWLLSTERRAKQLSDAIGHSSRVRPELFVVGQLSVALAGMTHGVLDEERGP